MYIVNYEGVFEVFDNLEDATHAIRLHHEVCPDEPPATLHEVNAYYMQRPEIQIKGRVIAPVVVPTISLDGDGKPVFHIRIDDQKQPAFWCELAITEKDFAIIQMQMLHLKCVSSLADPV